MALAKINNFRIFKKITPNGCFCRKTYFKLGQNLKLERAYLWKTGYACVFSKFRKLEDKTLLQSL